MLNNYIDAHSTLPDEALDWLEKQTNIHTNFPRMLSGKVQGELLRLLVQMSGAKRILEIGAFTGYSTICMASALPEDGHIDTLEINDELEDLMREGWRRAGLADKITLHIGDAISTLQGESCKTVAARGLVNGGTAGAAGGGMERSGSFAGLCPEGFDFVFIDANKREYCEYYELVMPMLRSGGIIVADDVLWDGKVYTEPVSQDAQTQGLLAFNDRVAKDSRVEVVMLPLRDGLSIIRKK